MNAGSSIATYFGLGKTQAELDFIDVPLDGDIKLFVDPFALAIGENQWCHAAHVALASFFESVVNSIRDGNDGRAYQKLQQLHEPNETHLGFSRGRPAGAGFGDMQAAELLEALKGSAAVKTGFLKHLEESELMIPGVGRDKISDLTTNVIRRNLADYTLAQCQLHGIPTQLSALPPSYNASTEEWETNYYEIPLVNGSPLLLVPKQIVRADPSYNYQKYYQHSVLNYLQSEHLSAGSALVHVFRSGKRHVFKKSLAAQTEYKLSKRFLHEFSEKHPEVLHEYREGLLKKERESSKFADANVRDLAQASAIVLSKIPPGTATAGDYHSFMVGVLELIFFPSLTSPVKEHEIHDGRKRIDIVMENAAPSGPLHRLHDIKKIPCAYVVFECKNYTREIANPELDQIQGRFSTNRGRLGFALCRKLDNRELFVKRCRDTFKDNNGLIIVLQDVDVIELLDLRAKNQHDLIDEFIAQRFAEVMLS